MLRACGAELLLYGVKEHEDELFDMLTRPGAEDTSLVLSPSPKSIDVPTVRAQLLAVCC